LKQESNYSTNDTHYLIGDMLNGSTKYLCGIGNGVKELKDPKRLGTTPFTSFLFNFPQKF